ncbi:hypothetical protein DPMN_051236 [Dreissena polymorpha]|uniref:DDE-1 domain-containing protein n=1 Tax=Dreissena polymorpha TaxID=45954 RepID=A0A9D4CHI8_DREPO|nr:hypothetical protein DPMN_051236 [Dreissena polymorpha]
MTGEKLPPLVIGKSAKPRCFRKIKTEKLPVMYRNNNKSAKLSQDTPVRRFWTPCSMLESVLKT